MSDAAWKAFEGRGAEVFSGLRCGPDAHGPGGRRTNVIHPHYASEARPFGRLSHKDRPHAVPWGPGPAA
jgi:hypothetical protein